MRLRNKAGEYFCLIDCVIDNRYGAKPHHVIPRAADTQNSYTLQTISPRNRSTYSKVNIFSLVGDSYSSNISDEGYSRTLVNQRPSHVIVD